LQRIPNLRFIVKDVYQGIDTIVIASATKMATW
jgi:hypothetical protein